jgi:N4-gp56 family major capsid protein
VASFFGYCHPDLVPDLRNISQFIPVEKYPQIAPYSDEVGAIEGIRFCTSTLAVPWLGGGATVASTGMLSTNSLCDVYPILIFGKNSYGLVPLRGKNAMRLFQTPTNVASPSDPLGQRGTLGWKAYDTSVILQDLHMLRVEVCVLATPASS